MRGHGPDCDLRRDVCTCGILHERMLDRWNEQRKRDAWAVRAVEAVYIWLPLLGVTVLTVMLLRWLGVVS